MTRAWVELPRDSGWADIRLAGSALHRLGYATEEVRGAGWVWLRLAGARLDVSSLWVTPP